jgi:hypothetical protein
METLPKIPIIKCELPNQVWEFLSLAERARKGINTIDKCGAYHVKDNEQCPESLLVHVDMTVL